MKAALATRPIFTLVEASESFGSYHSGVVDDPDCGTAVNHAILAVGWGYDDESNLEYWLMKTRGAPNGATMDTSG